MPIYEYCCEKCGHKFEALVFGQEKPPCKSCGDTNVNKLMSACGFLSKGGSGETTKSAAGASSCSGCATTNCGSCGH